MFAMRIGHSRSRISLPPSKRICLFLAWLLVPAGHVVADECTIMCDGFETPVVRLKVATFNTLTAFGGTVVDGNYSANPANVTTTINEFNSLDLDVAGLQEVHDYSALEDLAAGTGMSLAAAKTVYNFIFPTALLTKLPIVSQASYNTDGVVRLMNEIGVQLPDGSIAYLFSIHLSWEQWGRAHTKATWEIIQRRAGTHPVLVFGDMNGHTQDLIGESRGALSVIYEQNIDAILGSAHFQRIGEGENRGNLGFSDHPLLVAEVLYTAGSTAQDAVPSLTHAMPPETIWNAGMDIAPDTSVLDGIIIRRLPEKGVLRLGMNPVALDQSIASIELHDLVYEASAGEIGRDYWAFEIDEDAPVTVPRWADILIQTKISNIRFAQYPNTSPDTTEGHGLSDLAYANIGEEIYFLDDGAVTNLDTFNESLPAELQGLLFIRNGGRNESQWGGRYMYFELSEPTQVYVALGHRGDNSSRDFPGWTEQWSSVSFNANNARPYDIFTKCLDAGEVLLNGNSTAYGNRFVEENQVVFLGGSCMDPEPGCDNPLGPWAEEARDCAREDCSDGYWHAWDGKEYCRALMVHESESWTINRNPSFVTLNFWTDWGAADMNDCGDGVTTISIPECGLSEIVVRDGVEQQHLCDVSALETITIIKEGDPCEYVIIGEPHFQ